LPRSIGKVSVAIVPAFLFITSATIVVHDSLLRNVFLVQAVFRE
jgi:hypothetical protein